MPLLPVKALPSHSAPADHLPVHLLNITLPPTGRNRITHPQITCSKLSSSTYLLWEYNISLHCKQPPTLNALKSQRSSLILIIYPSSPAPVFFPDACCDVLAQFQLISINLLLNHNFFSVIVPCIQSLCI